MSRRPPLQLVIEDSTETLETYPPILVQATGTPTARIGSPATGFNPTAAGTACTVDSLSTSVDADAQEGATQLVVSEATWVRGRRYLITTTTGEVFPVVSQTSGLSDTLDVEEPLPRSVLTGATITGWRISVALSSTQTSTRGTGVVEWTATLNGVSRVWEDTWEIVHSDGAYTLTADLLTRQSPYAARMRADSDVDYSEAIDAAWNRFVLPSLMAKQVRPHLISSRKVLEPAHIAAVEYLLAMTQDNDSQMRAEKKESFNESMSLILASRDLWVNPDNGDVTTPNPDTARPWSTTEVWR
jgi:hypothetical protein